MARIFAGCQFLRVASRPFRRRRLGFLAQSFLLGFLERLASVRIGNLTPVPSQFVRIELLGQLFASREWVGLATEVCGFPFALPADAPDLNLVVLAVAANRPFVLAPSV